MKIIGEHVCFQQIPIQIMCISFTVIAQNKSDVNTLYHNIILPFIDYYRPV